MLRSALISLLLAAFLLVSGAAILERGQRAAAPAAPAIWDHGDMRVVAGAKLNSAISDAVTMDAGGQAIIEVDGSQTDLSELPLLHLKFRQRPDVLAMVIGWRPVDGGGRLMSHRVGLPPDTSFWLDMTPQGDWAGRASTLGVVFLGPPGGEVDIESIELLPPVFPYTLYLRLADWRTFVPWQHSDVNSHLGITIPDVAPYPVVAVAGMLTLSILLYLLGVRGLRARLRFRWSVIAALFFLCWLFLDSFWQYRLFRQVELTYDTFAGKSNAEKRRADLDGGLFEFIGRVNEALEEKGARVFLSSLNDYSGMRGAYYLYPHNVHWERHATSLPAPEFLKTGDYVLLLAPAAERFDVDSGYLLYGGARLRATPVMSSDIGALFRVI